MPAEKVDLELTFTPTANTAGDVYSNNVSGRDDQTPLLAVSEDVTVTVVSSTIRVEHVEVLHHTYSDHLPLAMEVALPDAGWLPPAAVGAAAAASLP